MKIEEGSLSLLYDNFYLLKKNDLSTKTDNVESLTTKKITMAFVNKMNEEEKEFFNKIISAIKIEISDLDLVFLNETDINNIYKKNGIVLIWDDNISEENKYRIILTEKNKLLKTDGLLKINNSQDLKARLWNCLKSLFLEKN
ncbi:MAG: hypothetical protein IT243_03085 [Bacteroidia bacterium]|nr:hypothetical protein [Bacteroidia bacterium]